MKIQSPGHRMFYILLYLLTARFCFAQAPATTSILDAINYGVVLDDPAIKSVSVENDVVYLQDDKGKLGMDIYFPPGRKKADKLPAIIFLNAIGDRPGERKVKSWGIYSSWPKLMAAKGYIGISMEADGSRIQYSIESLFAFLEKNQDKYNIDIKKLGVYAASANVTESLNYLMGTKVSAGIKAAVLYYGAPATGPFRKDLPVLFVISEGDVRPGAYGGLMNEVLKNNAPWTIKMGTGMPHAFDAFADNDNARKIIEETISFWKYNLEPAPAPSWSYSKGRDVLGSIQMDQPKAMSLLKSLTNEYPADITIRLFYANNLRRTEKFEEAATEFKKVLAIAPANVEAMTGMAVFCYAQNKSGDAEGYIAKAEQTGRMKRNNYAELGYHLLVANKNRESAIYYEKALALGPQGFDYYNLACAYAKYEEKDRAFAALDKSLKYGYGSKQQIENDTDLNSLHNDERYKKLISSIP